MVVATGERLPTVTRRPDRFLLVDYDTLLAVLTAQRPGEALPNEAWFGGTPPVGRPPYPEARVVSRAETTLAGLHADLDALAGWDGVAGSLAIAVPTLVIVGEHDAPAMVEHAQRWGDALPQAAGA